MERLPVMGALLIVAPLRLSSAAPAVRRGCLALVPAG
jgi:hypothetical protein